jgi:hypothetical protein
MTLVIGEGEMIPGLEDLLPGDRINISKDCFVTSGSSPDVVPFIGFTLQVMRPKYSILFICLCDCVLSNEDIVI